MEPNLSQALHLLNGDTVQNKINSGRYIENQLKAKTPPEQIIKNLYIRCYSREVKSEELTPLMDMVNSSKNQRETLEDIFWLCLTQRSLSLYAKAITICVLFFGSSLAAAEKDNTKIISKRSSRTAVQTVTNLLRKKVD